MWWRNKWDVSNRKAQDLLWRIRLNSLPTGSRLTHWGIQNPMAALCTVCPDDIQNHQHLFWDCTAAQQLWRTIGALARLAWPEWRLRSRTPCYADVLWEMQSEGLANNAQKSAWNAMFECAIRALWIVRCANKMEGKPYSFAKILGVFLATFGSTLEIVYLDYTRKKKDSEEFLRDWCGEGRIAHIHRESKKLMMGWWRREHNAQIL
jgi:hypothetical protein